MASDKRPKEMSAEEVADAVRDFHCPMHGNQSCDVDDGVNVLDREQAIALLTAWRGDRERFDVATIRGCYSSTWDEADEPIMLEELRAFATLTRKDGANG
jgi:hypothetical protein